MDKKNIPFIKWQRTTETKEILRKPLTFVLLSYITYYAKRTNEFNVDNLKSGETLVGNLSHMALSEQEYKTAKKNLEKWGLATFRRTNRGMIAKLTDTRVYDINEKLGNDLDNDLGNEQNSEQTNDQTNEPINDQNSDQRTTKERPKNDQRTTSLYKEYKNIRNKEDKERKEEEKENLSVPLLKIREEEFEIWWKKYIRHPECAKGDKGKAKIIFLEKRKKHDLEEMTEGLENYLADCGTAYTIQVWKFLEDEKFKKGCYEPAKSEEDKERDEKEVDQQKKKEEWEKKVITPNNSDPFFLAMCHGLGFMEARHSKNLHFCFYDRSNAYFVTSSKRDRDEIVKEYGEQLEKLFNPQKTLVIHSKDDPARGRTIRGYTGFKENC